jgi:uridine kinase
VLVGIDGPDAAGKTTLADRLAARLPGPVLRVSVDEFPAPRDVRYARGEFSPQGYYRDSFDLPALVAGRLQPFASGAPVVADLPVPERAALVADGVFLHRPELRDRWHLSVYLHVPEEETLRRAVVRDRALMGAEVERRYRLRYPPGQALHRREADPVARADVVVDNTDPEEPVVLRRD